MSSIGLEGQVRVDGGGAEALQQGHVVHLAGVAGLDDQARPGSGPWSRTRWWWTAAASSSDGIGARSAVELRSDRTMTSAPSSMAALDLGAARPRWRPRPGPSPPPGHLEQAVDGEGPEAGRAAVLVDVEQLGQVVVVDDRHGQDDLAARLGGRLEQVALGAERRRQRRHQLLADGVERRVGDLGEQLGEVVEEQARALGQHGDGRVGAHRADRLGAACGPSAARIRRSSSSVYPKRLLATDDRGVLRREHASAVGQVVEVGSALLEPVGVGVLGGQARP